MAQAQSVHPHLSRMIHHPLNHWVQFSPSSSPAIYLLDFVQINSENMARLRFFGHVAWMGDSQDTSRALYTSIRGLPKDWRRRPGRPRRTWLRTMEADLQPLNHGVNSAWRLAQDRERWKQLVETATLQSGACPR